MLPMIPEAAQAAGADWTSALRRPGLGRRWPSPISSPSSGETLILVPQDQHGDLDLATILGYAATGHAGLHLRAGWPLLDAVEQVLYLLAYRMRCIWSGSRPSPARDTRTEGQPIRDRAAAVRADGPLQWRPTRPSSTPIRSAGVSVLGSCLEGICGTCETGVLEGRRRPPRLGARRGRTGSQRLHDGLCLARPLGPTRTRHLKKKTGEERHVDIHLDSGNRAGAPPPRRAAQRVVRYGGNGRRGRPSPRCARSGVGCAGHAVPPHPRVGVAVALEDRVACTGRCG